MSEPVELASANGKVMDRAAFASLCSFNRRYKTLDLPGFDGPIRIQSLTAKEWCEIQAVPMSMDGVEPDKIARANAMYVAHAVVDDDGNRIFRLEDSDYEMIEKCDSSLYGPLLAAIKNHCEDYTPDPTAALGSSR